MPPAGQAQHPAAAGAQDQALLDQIGLDHVFQRVARLGQRRRQRLDADRAAAVVLGDAAEIAAVHRVEAEHVDLQPRQRRHRRSRDRPGGARDGGEVAHPAQQPPGDARRAAGAAGDLGAAVRREVEVELAGAAADDPLQLLGRVEDQPQRDAEAVAQRRGQQARRGWWRRPG